MTTNDYQPIACERYSEYEVHILRGTPLVVDADLPGGPVSGLCCRATDLQTRDGAEYIRLQPELGEAFWVRLDHLRVVVPGGT